MRTEPSSGAANELTTAAADTTAPATVITPTALMPLPLPLSVLAVTPIFDGGGTEMQLLELAEGLRARGHRMRLVTGAGTHLDDLDRRGVPFRLVRQTAGLVPAPVELVAYASAIYGELRAERAHIIQSTSIRTTYAAAAATFAYSLLHPRALAPAIVTTIHGGKREDIYAQARRHLRMLSDCVIVVSENGRDALVRGIHRADTSQRVHVIPPGRDLAAFSAITEGRVVPAAIPGVPDNARVVLHVGRLEPLKGQSYLLDAWALVAAQCEDAMLVIAGSGSLEDALHSQAQELCIEDRVVFAGYRTDLPALLARADLFVLSSLWEGLPMAAVEAMAAERAVVATTAGGTPEVVVDGETGLLAPPEDAPALARAIERVLADADLRRRLAFAGKQQAQRYTKDALISATLEVYRLAWERRQVHNQQALLSWEL